MLHSARHLVGGGVCMHQAEPLPKALLHAHQLVLEGAGLQLSGQSLAFAS